MKKIIAHTFTLIFFWLYIGALFVNNMCSTTSPFLLGVENINASLLSEYTDKHSIGRIGLIANQTSKDTKGNRTVDILIQKKHTISCIFSPEHGFNGTTLASINVTNDVDVKTGIPIISLYGHGTGKKIDATSLHNVDVLIYDLQDCGMRHYTYISLLMRVMQAALQYNKPVIVLDRPNPLGGLMEGPLVDPSLISFISIAPIPLRHGMTIGELAHYFNTYILEKPISLKVVSMIGYNRDEHIFTLLAPLSPNIANIQSLYGYSFLGLLGEISPFDVGVATNKSFQKIGLPVECKVDWHKVKELLKKYSIMSEICTYFVPHKKKKYAGVILSIPTMNHTSSLELFEELLCFFKQQGVPLSFSASFDKALGTSHYRNAFLNKIYCHTFIHEALFNENSFYYKALNIFIYKPFPSIH